MALSCSREWIGHYFGINFTDLQYCIEINVLGPSHPAIHSLGAVF
jgi:hypothetical protein